MATTALIAGALVYLFLIAPLLSGWIGMHDQVAAKTGILEKDIRILAGQAALKAEYAKLSKYAKSGGSDEQAISDTLSYIENISRNDSCFIVNIKPVGITKTGPYKEILVDVTAEAQPAQFSKFIYDIENPRDVLLDIKRFTLSARSGPSGGLKGTLFISKILLD